MPEGEKFLKTFFEVLEKQNMKNQTIFALYTDDNKPKYSSNPTTQENITILRLK